MRIQLVLLVPLVWLAACTAVPYSFHQKSQQPAADLASEQPGETAQPDEPQIERGEPYEGLDGIASWTFGLISKAVLWNQKVDNHEISQESEDALKLYLAENNLDSVKVRLNEYAPLEEWQRLFNNDSVGWGWRLTFGVLINLLYTVLPGRVFGGDNYNPYTDTISIYSDHPSVVLHEAGHAKDFAGRKWKGSYAFLRLLPFFSLINESYATGDVLGYYNEKKMRSEQQQTYRVLYPAYGTYVGGELFGFLSYFTPVSDLLSLVFVIPGHVVGRRNANRLDASDDPKFIAAVAQLDSPDWRNRCAAAETLGEYGPAAKAARPALEARRNDENQLVREEVEQALDEIGD